MATHIVLARAVGECWNGEVPGELTEEPGRGSVVGGLMSWTAKGHGHVAIQFEVLETLTGAAIAETLVIEGSLFEAPDLNERCPRCRGLLLRTVVLPPPQPTSSKASRALPARPPPPSDRPPEPPRRPPSLRQGSAR